VVAVDWGTSTVRATLMEHGRPVAREVRPQGVGRLSPGEHAAVLGSLLEGWMLADPLVLMAGMVGSNAGWISTDYVDLPAGIRDIAKAIRWLAPDELGPALDGWTVGIVPGLRSVDSLGEVDVMRGEETQVVGSGVTDGLVVMPGSHGKWVVVEHGRILGMRTFLTGEAFAALAGHTLLARSVGEAASGEDAGAFDEAIVGADGSQLLHDLFTVRTRSLEGAGVEASRSRLSGLLVAAEIRDGLRWAGSHERVVVVGEDSLVARYRRGLELRGTSSTAADPDASAIGIALILAERERHG
jgi:2-dehydro-3-deoxygalactonokinase